MLISIKDFATEKKVSVQAVYQQIKRHPELSIHIRKKKQVMYLDSYAQYILSGHEHPKTISMNELQPSFDYLEMIDKLNLKIQALEVENNNLKKKITRYDHLISNFNKENAKN